MVHRDPRKKWGRLTARPCVVPGKKERGQRMPTLTAWHLENRALLVTGRHNHAHGGAKCRCLYPRHIDVARERVLRSGEPRPKPWKGAHQRVRNPRAVD